eukprot:TRINITY_DN2399_c0_g1_i1.p1 TRINITY_DN2399_c0_g1~~TRINITY_DN2399_c0_g1_i1.p1  ORF type:complete len:114 (-),score=10.61 TRINITY_DN2399_c0_g1_i1:357-668(-)
MKEAVCWCPTTSLHGAVHLERKESIFYAAVNHHSRLQMFPPLGGGGGNEQENDGGVEEKKERSVPICHAYTKAAQQTNVTCRCLFLGETSTYYGQDQPGYLSL